MLEKRLPFDYLAKRNEPTDFIGPAGLVSGYLRHTKTDVLQFPPNTSYLQLHFSIKPSKIEKGELHLTSEALCYGYKDLVYLATKLQNNPRLQEVEVLIGVTNKRLARFASRKLGFNLVEHKFSLKEKTSLYLKAKSEGYETDWVFVYALREEFLSSVQNFDRDQMQKIRERYILK